MSDGNRCGSHLHTPFDKTHRSNVYDHLFEKKNEASYGQGENLRHDTTHRALVTGGADGIGAACVRRLAQDGFEVIIHFNRSLASAKKLADEVVGNGGTASLIQADLSTAMEAVRLAELLLENNPPTVIVNCAGLFEFTEKRVTGSEQFDRLFRTNVGSAAWLTRELAPSMPHGGSIINIGSIDARSPQEGADLYAASKAAIEGLTRAFAKELADQGIRCNCITPGATDTAMFVVSSEIRTRVAAQTRLGKRIGMPQDIANVVSFLAGKDSAWITGQIIDASGGLTI